jgi:DNA-directed RNA polymerase beta subunit
MEKQVLTKEISTIVKYLIELINAKADDDIDHLSNRRVEQLENNCLNNSVLV